MKPKQLKLGVREYVDNANENSTAFNAHTQPELVSYYNTVVDRKSFAFYFQNNPSNVAQLLGLSDDDKRNLDKQLQRIKKEFENKITNNGGNFAAMKAAVESMKNSQIKPSRSVVPLHQQQLDQITSFVDGGSADSLVSSVLTLSELGNVLQRTRKLAAFVCKFDRGAVASITSTTNDNALQFALTELRREVKEEINENGGDFEAFKNAIQQGGERVMGSRLIEVDNDFEDVGSGGDLQLVVVSSSDGSSSTVEVGYNFGYHLAKELYEDAKRATNGLVPGTTEYDRKMNKMSNAKARVKAITTLKDERKSNMTGDAMKLGDLLRSGLSNNDNGVVALAAYLVCDAKDWSLHSQKDALSRKCYDAYNAISFPDVDNLEESESYLEGESREKLGEGLMRLGGKMNSKMKTWHVKFKIHRSETLEYHAKQCLDPGNELAMKLLAQIEDKVKVLHENQESRSKRKANRDAKRHRAKKEAKLYAGGSLTMSELNNEAKKLYDQKTCSTVRRNK